VRFRKLTHPHYETDNEDTAVNPIRMIEDIALPGIICPACGTWAGSRRVCLPIDEPSLLGCLRGAPISQTAWMELADQVRTSENLARDFPLRPGDVLGRPRAELLDESPPDFLHPFPGQLIVQGPVVNALQEAGLTGYKPMPVDVHWSQRIRPSPAEPPALYELVVTGKAWRIGMNEIQITLCCVCGRRGFPNPEYLAVDESRWDGSDLFHVDANPNIVLVTERTCVLLHERRFSNYACISMSSS
jgi:hypothetical protein